MRVVVESRRKKLASVEKFWLGAAIIDVTSKGAEPWVRFSPFYPHGGIPIPNTLGESAQSVEGLWQGLKVFEREDIDPGKWAITDMSGIKRGQEPRGRPWAPLRRRQRGPTRLPKRPVPYLPARLQVGAGQPAGAQIEELWRVLADKTLVLLDYETNADPEDLSSPLSHAALVMYQLQGSWPTARAAEAEPGAAADGGV
jgi:hypothetical protein